MFDMLICKPLLDAELLKMAKDNLNNDNIGPRTETNISMQMLPEHRLSPDNQPQQWNKFNSLLTRRLLLYDHNDCYY